LLVRPFVVFGDDSSPPVESKEENDGNDNNHPENRAGTPLFVALLALDGDENPLTQIPAFGEFQGKLPAWIAEKPTAEPLTIVGSYRLF
jgi:hypothetical protein